MRRLTRVTLAAARIGRAARAFHLRPWLPVRVPRRLVLLAGGVAIIPIGLALSLGLAATPSGSSSSGSSTGSGLASALERFHGLPPQGPPFAPGDPGVPTLVTLPAAPSLSVLQPPDSSRGSASEIPATSEDAATVEADITAAAEAHGVSPSWMISTAECESGLHTNSYNPSGPYYGLFQFLMSTFTAHGGTDIWDPVQQSDIAASMFASGDSVAWPVCSRQ